MEIDVVRSWPSDGLRGRRKIYTTKREIADRNVVEVVNSAYTVHLQNVREMVYLDEYKRGKQDVRDKVKLVRPDINNKIVVNRADEIVTFKDSYFLSDPIQYVSRGANENVSQSVNMLNTYMVAEDKEASDQAVVHNMHVFGVGYRMVVPDSDGTESETPACIYTPDPKDVFCIYWSGVSKKKLAAVLIQQDDEGEMLFCVYTTKRYYEIKGGKIVKNEQRRMPFIPIIEYPNNLEHSGAFEPVVPLLNAINDVTSNRVDGIQDFVNAYDVFQNCEISKEKYEELSQGGHAIQIRSHDGNEAKVYRIASVLDQNGTQQVVDDLWEAALTICGMPNRNGGSSTSDTGTATIYRDGWADAEARAKDTEKMYNKAEREFLKILLYIYREKGVLDIQVSDLKIEHTRNNLSNMQSRMQVLCEGLNNDKIHPKIPWRLAGVPNAEEYCKMSMEHYEKEQEKLRKRLGEELNAERGLRTSGQGDRSSSREVSNSV